MQRKEGLDEGVARWEKVVSQRESSERMKKQQKERVSRRGQELLDTSDNVR